MLWQRPEPCCPQALDDEAPLQTVGRAGSLERSAAKARQGRGLRRSTTELCAVAWAVRPKPSTHDRAVAGFRLEALSACPVPSKLSVARRRKRRCTTEARPSKYTSLGRILAGRSLDHGGCPSVVLTAG